MAAAVVQLSKAPMGVLPPASPFAELLRRSRFASYDPSIKQAYSSPPAYAHRGNWGLKRPIAQRRKDAFITLKSYEDHAQYVEWNNAEAQVRFVKRFEEMNVTPDVQSVAGTRFVKNLGPVHTRLWLTDSEFDRAVDGEYRYQVESEEGEEDQPKAVLLGDLGNKGPGAYGAHGSRTVKAPLVIQKDKPWNYRQPNVEAMSAEEFERYLEKLRDLRPRFLHEIRGQLKERAKKGEVKSTLLQGELSDMKVAAINTVSNDHRAFLNNYYEEYYAERDEEPAAADPTVGQALPKDFVSPRIKPQPHRFGGLTYAHPSLLDTYFSTQPQPAFVLQGSGHQGKFHAKDVKLQTSFGGVVADLERGRMNLRPLFTHNAGPSPESVGDSVVNVRVKAFKVMEVPNVVGRDAQGLRGVKVAETVVEDVQREKRAHWDNPQVPGSWRYVSMLRSVKSVGLGPPVKKTSKSAFQWNRTKQREVMSKLRKTFKP